MVKNIYFGLGREDKSDAAVPGFFNGFLRFCSCSLFRITGVLVSCTRKPAATNARKPSIADITNGASNPYRS